MLLTVLGGLALADETATDSAVERNAAGFLVHRIESPWQASPTTIRVLLPDPLQEGTRYPVLYVLPVEAGDGSRYGDGLEECLRREVHKRHQVICVAPTFADLPWYADHANDPRIQQERYLLNVVVPLVDKTYPTIAKSEGRWLVGFSKSGWGAFSLLLRHLDVFGKAAAWDAPLMKERPDQFGMGGIFETQENFQRYQVSRLLTQRAAELRSETRLFHLGYGNFRDHHQQCEKLLAELRIRHRYQDGPKREHTWHSGWLPEAVAMLAESK